jgi:hypothetical protein
VEHVHVSEQPKVDSAGQEAFSERRVSVEQEQQGELVRIMEEDLQPQSYKSSESNR